MSLLVRTIREKYIFSIVKIYINKETGIFKKKLL